MQNQLAKLQAQFPFTPHNNNVIIDGFKEEDKSSGGIIIPESAQRSLTQGMVIKVSEPNYLKLQPGDIVLFGLHTESKVVIDGHSFLIVNEDNIQASMKP